MQRSLGQVALGASDLNRAIDCYRTILASDPAAVFPDAGIAFFSLGESRLMIERDGPPSRIYVVCDRVDSEIGRLVEEGIELISPPHRIFEHADDRLGPSGTEEWQAFVKDSEGNLVGLIEFRTGS